MHRAARYVHALTATRHVASHARRQVATGNAEQTQAVLACDALTLFRRLMDCGKKELKKEACWIVSNITAGSAAQIDAVCASGLVPTLIRARRAALERAVGTPSSARLLQELVVVAARAGLVSEEEFEVRKEAAYALCNACTGGSQQTLSGLVYHGVIARSTHRALCSHTARPPMAPRASYGRHADVTRASLGVHAVPRRGMCPRAPSRAACARS